MRVMTTLGMAVVLLLAMCASSFGSDQSKVPSEVKVQKVAAGQLFADSKGMTLYTFDRDTAPGKSACNGPCAQNWPPLAAKPAAMPMGDWTVVTRDDGSKQWAYKGKPLYTWGKDSKPGDTTGDGFNSVWHIAKP